MRAHFVIIRSLIHYRRVVVSNVCDVGRLIDDGHVAFRRQQRLFYPRRPEFAARDEAILVRTNIVITIGPISNASALIESRFWRERRPADIVVTLAP